MTEQIIKLTAGLYKCRDSAKSLAKIKGLDYKEMLKDYIDIISAVMKKEKLDYIPALLFISKTKAYNESGMAQLLFMASVCEMMEPSK